jgi:glycogen operon protein
MSIEPHPHSDIEDALGAICDGGGVHFRVFSANAGLIELCLFDRGGKRQTDRIRLSREDRSIWHGYVSGLNAGQLYGYRAHGPYEPAAGHRFNPNKVLLDPHARELSGSIVESDLNYGYVVGHRDGDLSYDGRDNAAVIPKCRVADDSFDWGEDRRPVVSPSDMVVYELHVRGMTIGHPGVPPDRRGRFLGLSSPAILDHLRRLGVTTVELMPVTAAVTERHLSRAGLRNYWGYNPAIFSAFEPRYGDGVTEFKTMVRELHAAGIQVILDVVFSHSGEGGHLGPTLSFRGLDNAAYYRLVPYDKRRYVDLSGCQNTLHCGRPHVLRLILDTLRYWMKEMRVDGFRFDLATSLARSGELFDAASPFFAAIAADPLLSRAVLIAEPWAVDWQGYQLGRFPEGWIEWNDRYRDTIRRFWRGDRALSADLAARMAGSRDIFPDRRGPLASLNYVTAHDGFTLQDLVSYSHKRNEANLEGGADGQTENYSFNCGEEGPATSETTRRLRRRQKRNILATLFLSQGVPMISAGDEIGRTQAGNNNAYCQDNETSWLDWEETSTSDEELVTFIERLAAIRKAHPVLRCLAYFEDERQDRGRWPTVSWFAADGRKIEEKHLRDPQVQSFTLVASATASMSHDRVALMINGSPLAEPFSLPAVCLPPIQWRCLLDTAESNPFEKGGMKQVGESYIVESRSLVLFVAAGL